MTKRWVDVNPKDWFYRVVLESDRIFLDSKKETTLFNGVLYNKFIKGKPRGVYNFTTTEGQTSFKISGYLPDSRETVIVYIDGVPFPPSKLEKDYVHVGFPMSGGKEVSVYLSGVVELHQGDNTIENCQTYPTGLVCDLAYPSKTLQMAKQYVFDVRYSLNEVAVCMGKKLKRVNVEVRNGEKVQDALTRAIGHKDDCFTIIDGVLYVSYNLNGFPIYVNYNYKSGAVVKNRQKEKVVPNSKCVVYNDRFFPHLTISRGEFFALLQRMRKNLYSKYTDRGYQPNIPAKSERYVSDRKMVLGKWYGADVLDILDEKFNDGCYVFPLYEDDSFQPEGCVTRAEAVVYLHRFIEWALERFR